MGDSGLNVVMDRLRQMLLGSHSQVTARLERELDELRRSVRDPSTLRALVVEALQEEINADPSRVAAVLTPALDQLTRARAAAKPSTPSRQWALLPVLIAVAAAGLGAMSWRGHSSAVNAATQKSPATETGNPMVALVEERSDGFGLGEAARNDAELVREVRARLSGCVALAGAQVSFSVRDGWVWLRGEASADGRAAAARALDGLGPGVLVVNQLVATDSTDKLAER